MLRSTALLLLALVFSSAASAQTTVPIFREIDLGTWGHITLGEPFAQADSIGIPDGERTYRLRPRTFGGAEEIRVVLSAGGAVEAIHFAYAPLDESYDRQLRGATRMLGEPVVEASSEDDGTQVETARWQDDRTVLEVVRRSGSGGVEVFTVMRDRAPSPS